MMLLIAFLTIICFSEISYGIDTSFIRFNREYCTSASDIGSNVIFWTVKSRLACAKMCIVNCIGILLNETSDVYQCAIIDYQLDLPPITDADCQNLNTRVKVYIDINSSVKGPKPPCPTDCNLNRTVAGQKYCISVKPNVETYTRAREICPEECGDLVEVGTTEDLKFLSTGYDSDHSIWLGGNDSVTQGHYVWHSGRDVSEDMFCKGQPSEIDERCIVVKGTQNCIRDWMCDSHIHFICARPYP